MTKYFFKLGEVFPYRSNVDPFYGIPQDFDVKPFSEIRGVLYDPKTNRFWHSISRTTKIINDEVLSYHLRLIVDSKLIVGLKEKKSIESVKRKVHDIGENGVSYKFYRLSGELYISHKLLQKIFKYFRGELYLQTPKNNSHLKHPSFEGLQNTLSDIILNVRVRDNNSKSNYLERKEIRNQISVLNKSAPPDFIDSVVDEVMEIIIKNDLIRNRFLLKRLNNLFATTIHENSNEVSYFKEVCMLWCEAFNAIQYEILQFSSMHSCEEDIDVTNNLLSPNYSIFFDLLMALSDVSSNYLANE